LEYQLFIIKQWKQFKKCNIFTIIVQVDAYSGTYVELTLWIGLTVFTLNTTAKNCELISL